MIDFIKSRPDRCIWRLVRKDTDLSSVTGVEMVVLDDHGEYFVDLRTRKVDESSYIPIGRSSYLPICEEIESGGWLF